MIGQIQRGDGLLVWFNLFSLLAVSIVPASAALLPWVWRRSPSAQGWSLWRKLRFTLAMAIFVSFGALLAAWGALRPWVA